jgi:intracellular sulfur oxidation DsrE/DsrF family protein
MFRNTLLIFSALFFILSVNQAMADDRDRRHGHSNNDCPVASPYPASYGEMFGMDVARELNCNDRRHRVKIVMQVNKYCRDSHDSSGNPITSLGQCYKNDMEKDDVANRDYAVINMIKMVEDLEVTHGMKPSDYDMVAVVHSGGAALLTRGNPYEGHVKKLMKSGVKFYLCLNTAASWIKSGKLTRGAISGELIEGVGYVPAGLSAISDFQHQGYKYVQP